MLDCMMYQVHTSSFGRDFREGQADVRQGPAGVGSYLMELPAELLEKLRVNAGNWSSGLSAEMKNALILGKEGPCPPVRTAIDGRFHLTGAGRDRAVLLLIEGDFP
jgi:hypothetical protein